MILPKSPSVSLLSASTFCLVPALCLWFPEQKKIQSLSKPPQRPSGVQDHWVSLPFCCGRYVMCSCMFPEPSAVSRCTSMETQLSLGAPPTTAKAGAEGGGGPGCGNTEPQAGLLNLGAGNCDLNFKAHIYRVGLRLQLRYFAPQTVTAPNGPAPFYWVTVLHVLLLARSHVTG